MTMTSLYHRPVMLQETLSELQIIPGGTYVDLTFGGGGHAKAILEQLEEGKLWVFDQDEDARKEAEAIQDDRLYFIQGNFRFFSNFLKVYHVPKVDGVLADLGVSSHQLDSETRGFAARLEGPLDMRMHAEKGLTAAKVVNSYTKEKLYRLFRDYGDVHNAYRLATQLVEVRNRKSIATIREMKEALAPCVPKGKEYKYYAKVFQALRIVVNDEQQALEEMLFQIPEVLAPHGRFVVITYHSGEDRPVKHFLKTGNIEGHTHYDVYGNLLRPLVPVYTRVLRPTQREIELNNRARSARMRVATLSVAPKRKTSTA